MKRSTLASLEAALEGEFWPSDSVGTDSPSFVLKLAPGWIRRQKWSATRSVRPLYWNQLRITGGSEPLALGANNSGRTVGGSTVHYAAFCPRLHPSDFMVRTLDGVAADWPIRDEDIEPYYEQMEREFPVAGPAKFPWGRPHGYPYALLQSGTAGHVLIRGCIELGIPVVAGGPIGITAGTFGKRPHCFFRGFCLQGCKVGAKHSTLVSHLPDAIDHAAEIRAESMAFDIPIDGSGRVTGVRYYRTNGNGQSCEETQKAKVVVVGNDPRTSVVNQFCRSWDVPNLFICDGSVMVTQGSANPALTISAIAARTADYLRNAATRQEL